MLLMAVFFACVGSEPVLLFSLQDFNEVYARIW